MLHLLNLCFPTVFFFKHASLLPWQAVCRVSPLSMATSHPLSENVPMLCHSMANHLSVLGQAGIESIDSFASVTNAPPARSLKHVTVIQSLNPTQNTTDKVRPSGFSWMPPSVLAYTTKTLISRNGWLGCQASTRLSGDQPCIVQSGIQEIFTQSKVERRWLSVTRS